MTKETFLWRLRWRLRLEMPGQRTGALVEPYVRLFREGLAAGRSEAELVAECGGVRLAAAEILSTAAPDRVRFLWVRVALVASLWLFLYKVAEMTPSGEWLPGALLRQLGLAVAFPLLLVAGAAATFGLLGAKRLLRRRTERTNARLGWQLGAFAVSVGLIVFLLFGISKPILDAAMQGVSTTYVDTLYRVLAGSEISSIGRVLNRLFVLHAWLTGALLLWTGIGAARLGGAYLPLLCAEGGVLLAGAQYIGSLRMLTDADSGYWLLRDTCGTLCFGLGLALLVGLTLLLARRLTWLRN